MNIYKSAAILIMTMLLFGSCKEKKPMSDEISIVPQPNTILQQQGFFTVNSKTVIVVPEHHALKELVDFVNDRFKHAAGFQLEVTSEQPSQNYISIQINEDASIKPEGYSLAVSSHGVSITASTERGAFYGITSMLQLLPAELESKTLVEDMQWYMPCVEIKDEPRFVWRGMHLDVCRHFVPVEFIKKQLDVMALFKMNTFHWHLTEDQGWRIEIKKYPKLTVEGAVRVEGEGNEYGGFYTQDEVKEIVAYAKARFINVVPEIELPGHSLAAITAYPHLSCTGGPFKVRNIWGVEPDVYCAGKEEVFAFLEDIMDEVVPLFPYEYFHIGGDESPKDRWEVCSDCQKRIQQEGLKNEHELQSYFIKRIEKVLLSHDKKMIGWDEILEGGLAESAAVMSWRGEEGGIEAAEQGHDVVMTPGNWVYLDHYQGSSKIEPVAIGGYTTLEESYGYDPVPKHLDAEKAKHILGTQGNVWSEYLYTPALTEYRIYPRIIALAEVGWTHTVNKDYLDFLKRLDKQFLRLDKHQINYHIPLPEGPTDKMAFIHQARLEFTTTRPIKMVYTLDGREPTADSDVYSTALTFTENATVKIRSVVKSGRMSKVRTIKVEKQELLPAVEVSTTHQGLKMNIAKGNYIKVADLDKTEDWEESSMTNTNFKGVFDLKEPSAAILTGFVEIPEDGVYEFSSDVDQFFIGGKLLIDNDGEVKRHSRNNSTIALSKGKHAVKVIFLNNIIGGWPSAWSEPVVRFKNIKEDKFVKLKNDMYSF